MPVQSLLLYRSRLCGFLPLSEPMTQANYHTCQLYYGLHHQSQFLHKHHKKLFQSTISSHKSLSTPHVALALFLTLILRFYLVLDSACAFPLTCN